jgi:hypothetical protein
LGSLPLWGKEGVTLTTTTEDFLNNSYIEDFYSAKTLSISINTAAPKGRLLRCDQREENYH